MRPFKLFVLFILITSGLRAQQLLHNHPFTLKGTVVGKHTGLMTLQYYDWEARRITDTCKVIHGKFSFSGLLKDPTFATLKGFNWLPAKDGKNSVELFLEPGKMTVTVTENSYNRAVITGSRTQQEFESYTQKAGAIKKQTAACDAQYDLIAASLEKTVDQKQRDLQINRMEQLKKELDIYRQQSGQLECTTIRQHPQSFLSPYLLFTIDYRLTLDSLKMLYGVLSEPVKRSYYGFYEAVAIRQRENLLPGRLAADFTTEEVNGKPLTLSSFRNKSAVLLDFWASWCDPCRAEIPHLKALYQKYHGLGLEIISVSVDKDFEAWKAAIKADSTEYWHHIPMLKNPNTPFNFNPTEDDLRFKYPIGPIPRVVLIDKKGYVVASWQSRSDENCQDEELKLKKLFEQ